MRYIALMLSILVMNASSNVMGSIKSFFGYPNAEKMEATKLSAQDDGSDASQLDIFHPHSKGTGDVNSVEGEEIEDVNDNVNSERIVIYKKSNDGVQYRQRYSVAVDKSTNAYPGASSSLAMYPNIVEDHSMNISDKSTAITEDSKDMGIMSHSFWEKFVNDVNTFRFNFLGQKIYAINSFLDTMPDILTVFDKLPSLIEVKDKISESFDSIGGSKREIVDDNGNTIALIMSKISDEESTVAIKLFGTSTMEDVKRHANEDDIKLMTDLGLL